MDVGWYKYNYEGFYKKSIYQMSINREKTTTTRGVYTSLVGILIFIFFSLLMKSLEKEI